MDPHGLPLSLVVDGANRHDVKLLEKTLDARVPKSQSKPASQHLCADAAYQGEAARQCILQRDYQPHIRSRGEEKQEKQEGKQARRWVVEVFFSWINRFRKLLVRFEKKAANYVGLLQFACALIVWRKLLPVHSY